MRAQFFPDVIIDEVSVSVNWDGAGAEENPVVRSWGEKPVFDFPPLPHDELGAHLGILDSIWYISGGGQQKRRK